VSLERLVALLTCGAAQQLDLPVGTLSLGAPADVAVVDADAAWVVDPEQLESRGKNTPLVGRELRGRAVLTVMDGRVVYRR
jgi:dihydroorotase